MITVTVEKINGDALAVGANTKYKIDRDMFARPPQPLTADTVGSKCKLWIKMDIGGPQVQEWLVTETFAAVTDAITTDSLEAGAELQANKDASGGYAGLTLFKLNMKNVLGTITSWFTNANTVARTYTLQDRDGTIADDTDLATKINTSAKDATGGVAGLTLFKINFKNAANTFTSFFTNSNTAARTYTFQDRDGTIADDTDLALKLDAAALGKIASGALTAGVRTVNDAAIQATSIVTVQRIVTGGTAAVGGYKVTINAGVSVVITALQVDCVTTETSCTDTVMATIQY